MSAQVAHLVRAVVMRPLFPELLAAAVADAPVIDDAAESARFDSCLWFCLLLLRFFEE